MIPRNCRKAQSNLSRDSSDLALSYRKPIQVWRKKNRIAVLCRTIGPDDATA